MRSGRQIEVVDPAMLMNLAARYELVIVASGASEKFYDRIRDTLTLKAQPIFRMYSREYFERFSAPSVPTEDRVRAQHKAWQEILKENHVAFELQRKVMSEDYSPSFEEFNAEHLEEFISDPRVDFIHTREDIMSRL
jgi:hypothetical protein